MRFIHTADWHLGRLFHAQHLTEDQSYILDQFIDLVREVRPDAVIIAGDIYDRAVPPPDAVRLLDETLAQLVRGLGVPVIMIAGNHDSPDRLGFGARLLADQRLHIFGAPTAVPGHLGLHDQYGPIHLYALPYAEPPIVRHLLQDDAVQGHDAAHRAQLALIREMHPRGERSIVVAHAFVAGGSESDSERPLSVGGAGTVDASAFAGFNYVALGHLHRPQSIRSGGPEPVGASMVSVSRGDDAVPAEVPATETRPAAQTELLLSGPGEEAEPSDHDLQGEAGQAIVDYRIRYSGSLLKYSFSEVDHAKSISIVELDAEGRATIEEVQLRPRRDVRRIEGSLAELIAAGRADPDHDDYIMATLTDQGALLDPIGRLREVYPNVLQLERTIFNIENMAHGPREDHRKLSEVQLFQGFMEEVTGSPITPEQEAAFIGVVEGMVRAEREVE